MSSPVAFGFDRGRVDFFSTASQPPARHRATSLPTQTVEIPYCRATDPCDWPARTASTLLDNPQRVGQPLRDDLDGIWSARRGTYRVLYRIHEARREVVVLRIDHRRDAYRPLA